MTKKEKETGITAGTRRIVKMGGSLGVTLPPAFTKACQLKEGDILPYVASNYILEFLYVPEKPEVEKGK